MAEQQAKTILVVDDDEEIRSMIEMALDAEGYAVKTAEHGRAALSALEASLPSVILLDMKMPVMDGREFAREFFSRYGRKVPVVVLTAAEDAQRRAVEIGADGWLGKPFELEELLGTLERFCAS